MLGVMVVAGSAFYLLLRTIPKACWLILNHRVPETVQIIRKIGEENPEEEAEQIRASVHEGVSSSLTETLFQKKYFKPIFFAVLLAYVQPAIGNQCHYL
jgi:hypothetical protein